MKLAFSTVACPTWTLDRAIDLARRLGYVGVDLRSLGPADPTLACDPCHTDGAKIREWGEEAGVGIAGVSTSVRFDAPVWPPVIGRVCGDFDAPVRACRGMVGVARGVGADYVRVFGFELRPGEDRERGSRRVVERVSLAATTARHTGVRLAVEGGGSFATARRLIELVDRVSDPLVGVGYAIGPAAAAGDDPARAILELGDRLAFVKITDLRDGRPVPIGEGDLPIEETIAALARARFGGWVVVEWPRLWMPELADPEGVLARAAERLYAWSSSADAGGARRASFATV